MALINLEPLGSNVSEKVKKRHQRYENLLSALKRKQTSPEFDSEINTLTDALNKLIPTDPKLASRLRKSYHRALMIAEKKMQFVSPKTYVTRYTAIGMSVIGIPLGTGLGLVMDNMAYIGAFFGVGIAIGAGLGIKMDKKAEKEGRVLDVESL